MNYNNVDLGCDFQNRWIKSVACLEVGELASRQRKSRYCVCPIPAASFTLLCSAPFVFNGNDARFQGSERLLSFCLKLWFLAGGAGGGIIQ